MRSDQISKQNNILIRIMGIYKEIIEDKMSSMTAMLRHVKGSDDNAEALLGLAEASIRRTDEALSRVNVLLAELEKSMGTSSEEIIH